MSSSPLPDDPYKILGVDQTASSTEIRSAHRKLVLKCHPDKVQDEALKAEKSDEFHRIQRAYELLSDDQARTKYHEKLRLAELRAKLSKANTSSPRTPKAYSDVYEVRTNDVPRSPYSPSSPRDAKPRSKVYYSAAYNTSSSSYDDEDRYAPAEARREDPRYAERASREREYERELRRRAAEREQAEVEARKQKERERERRKDLEKESARRSEKGKTRDPRDARHSDRKARDKTLRRDVEEKRKHRETYIEPLDDDIAIPRSSSKRSTARRPEDRRDEPLASPMTPEYDITMDNAHHYISSVRTPKPGGLQRAATYHERSTRAPAPTPPITKSPTKPPYNVSVDDDIVRRSSAAPSRRGSEDVASRQKPSASPPRAELPRHNTMPIDPGFGSRPPPQISRAATFNSYGEADVRGRNRSRMSSQVDSEDIAYEYAQREREREREREYFDRMDRVDRERDRDRKIRSSSKSTREPSLSRGNSKRENVSRYMVSDSGTTRLHSQYARDVTDPVELYETRPSRPPLARENHSSHLGGTSSSSTAQPRYKFKMSRAYDQEDFAYSRYSPQAGYA